ncbi:MAG TPA: HlyD family type I secretion periplasmic adaptor subunit [Rhizomicrobium sp.]|jgi:HlyD family secretion protein|nr:HlyD family type I secretion periplasmic adaptor subunit [Rhizomicrobium sp.]
MSTSRLDRAANDFKPDAVAIAEAPVPVTAHIALYVVLLLLVGVVLWAVIGTVDRIVVAQGKITTRTPMLVMQPFTTSRVVSIDVKPGDHVVKGQVLARFDPAFASADVASLRQKVALLTAQTQRLEAQLSGGVFTAGPQDGPERLTQAQIFAQELNDYRAEIEQRESRLGQIDSQIRTGDAAMPGMRQQLGMAQRVVEMQDRLQRQRAAATLDVMRAQSGLIDSELRLKNIVGEREKLVQQRAETLQERQSFMEKWRSDHNQQLVKARQDLVEAAETLNKANRMQDFTEMRAPVDGVVQQVADRSIGSVLREAETLVTLVPDGADLYVEGNVATRDISYIKLGDETRIKLEAYPFQRFGTAQGRVTEISPDAIQLGEGEDARPVYRVQVRLSDDRGMLAGRGLRLRPGMVATAEIKTGTRTIASYILDPILRISDESLREP